LFDDAIVVNTSVMSSFHKIKRFDILHKLCKNVIVPKGVLEEFSEEFGQPKSIKPYELNHEQLTIASELGLGKGESQTIAIAMNLNKMAVLDESQARKLAKKLGVNVIGTFGLIKISFEDCIINDSERKAIISELSNDQRSETWLTNYVLEAKKLN
jgi:predicted nucleic acid-binding protein